MQRLRIIACSIIALFCLCQSARGQGTVSAWGLNGNGQLGNGTLTTTSPFGIDTPGPVSGLSGVTAIAGGGFHSLALKSDGTVWAWGGNVLTGPYAPVQVLGLSGVTAIAGRVIYSLALKSDGTVWTWALSNTPVQVPGLSSVTALAGGWGHSLALKSDRTVWTWGFNSNGQLGNGTFTDSNTPVQVLGPGGVGSLTGVTAIAGGSEESLALKSDGTVWAWGGNAEGELGNGTLMESNTPVQVLGPGGVGFLTGVTAVATEFRHSLALNGATPSQAIDSLIGQVISPSLGFTNGEQTSLTAKLQAALGYLGAGDTADAIAVLQAFINEVNALVNSGRLTTAAAAPLISAAEGIIAEL